MRRRTFLAALAGLPFLRWLPKMATRYFRGESWLSGAVVVGETVALSGGPLHVRSCTFQGCRFVVRGGDDACISIEDNNCEFRDCLFIA